MSGGTIFVAVTPCRLVDTRNPVGLFNGPGYTSGETRTYDVAAGPCSGLPAAVAAYSLNFTVANYDVNIGGFVTAYPAGSARPGVSTVNYGTGPPVANAAIVSTGETGQISVFAYGSTNLIIDVNGYFLGGAGTLPEAKKLHVNADNPDGPAVWGTNVTTTSAPFTTGVYGNLTATTLTDGSGVLGYTAGGTTWGVRGFNAGPASNNGGVLGISGARVGDTLPFNAAGVRGESPNGFGVLGNTNTAAGVGGTYIDSQGNILRSGYLANGTYAVYAAGDLAATGSKSTPPGS